MIHALGRSNDMKNDFRDYLCHHGVKGQKWGVRRYQNKDGTLTEEGKRRYSKTLNEVEKEFNIEQYNDNKNYTWFQGFKNDGEHDIAISFNSPDSLSKSYNSYKYLKKNKKEILDATTKAMKKKMQLSNDVNKKAVDFLINEDHIDVRYCDPEWGWMLSEYHPSVKKTKTYYI